jgi:hypothetical protein
MKNKKAKFLTGLFLAALAGLFAWCAEAAELSVVERAYQAMTPGAAEKEPIDADNWTKIAMLNPNPEVIDVILRRRVVDIDIKDHEGYTALMKAAWQNPNPKVVMTLLEAGADPNVEVLSKGQRIKALHFALNNEALKNTKTLEALIAATDPSARRARNSIVRDGAFGPNLGDENLRLGTRFRAFSDLYTTLNSAYTKDQVIDIYKLDDLTRLMTIHNPGSEEASVSHSLPNAAASLVRGQAQKKWPVEDYVEMCEAYLPLAISVKIGGGSSLLFLQENRRSGYRLIACGLSPYFWPDIKFNRSAKEIAAFVLDNYGEENRIDDFYKTGDAYFWKDPFRGYAIYVCEAGDYSVIVFPVLDDRTIYPLQINLSDLYSPPKLFSNAEFRPAYEQLVKAFEQGKRRGNAQRATFMPFEEYVAEVSERALRGSDKAIDYWAMGFTRFGNSLDLK